MYFEQKLTDKQILDEFIQLVENNEQQEVLINKVEPARLSAPQHEVKGFIYRRFTGRRLIDVLESEDNYKYILNNTNIYIHNMHNHIWYKKIEDRHEMELEMIDRLIKLINRKNKIIINTFMPTDNSNIKKYMELLKIDKVFFLYILNKHKDVLREQLKVAGDGQYLILSA
nr:hypothetical protein [Priestia aryabhattai]MDH3113117.1 hypothetical protein [Priestia aryabhattai]